MAKQTLRRKKHKKSRRLQRKSLGLQRKSRRLHRKSLGLQRKSLGLHRKSRIQRGGRILTMLELYTALMSELLDEVYLTHGLPDSQLIRYQLIRYINNFFVNPRNFIKCIKARMVQENNEAFSFGQVITTTTTETSGIYNNDNLFVVNKFLSEPKLQEKWFEFVKSLQDTIDNMFDSHIDMVTQVKGRRRYDLTNPKDIEYLRDYINRLKEGDGLGKNALHKALDRIIQWQKDETTGKPTPSSFLKDIIKQVEDNYPAAAAEINKPKLTTLTTLTDDKQKQLKIYTSFVSDSATLYIYNPNGKFIIANTFADKSAQNVRGGLKQIHPIITRSFVYSNLQVGTYILVLESFPEQYRSDELILTVSDPNKLPEVETRAAATTGAAATPRAAATGETGETTVDRSYAPEGWVFQGNVWKGPTGGYMPVDTYKPRPGAAADQLPEGWKALTDPASGKIYYANITTEQSQWERPVASAEINKPKLTANKNTLKRGESVSITPSFESDSATLYVTFNGKTMEANSDVDGSAIDVRGGLKQIHKKQFTYFNLPAGEYTFQLIEFPNIQHQSDPLKITVSEATEAGAVASSRPRVDLLQQLVDMDEKNK